MRRHGSSSIGFACLRRFAASESGATAVEYALLSLIAIAVVAAVSQLGGAVGDLYRTVYDKVASVVN
jgi:Flp pilus assembly pilin Flp